MTGQPTLWARRCPLFSRKLVTRETWLYIVTLVIWRSIYWDSVYIFPDVFPRLNQTSVSHKCLCFHHMVTRIPSENVVHSSNPLGPRSAGIEGREKRAKQRFLRLDCLWSPFHSTQVTHRRHRRLEFLKKTCTAFPVIGGPLELAASGAKTCSQPRSSPCFSSGSSWV